MSKSRKLLGMLTDQTATEGEEGLSEHELLCLRKLVSIGMRGCRDPELLAAGEKTIAIMDARSLHLHEQKHINVLPQEVKPGQMGGTLTIGHGSKPSAINPLLTTDTISTNLMEVIFSNLVKFDNTGRAIPDLAYNWEVSPDGLLYTFFIRDDARFHDGHPLTAHDVEFTYRSMAESKIPLLAQTANRIEDMDTQGDYVFKVKLKHPYSAALQHLCRAIAPKHLLGNADLQASTFDRQPIGTGPFKVTEWSDDNTIVLERNKLYFQKSRPVLDRLVLRCYEDRDSAIEAIQTGEVDIALDLTYRDILFLSAGQEFHTHSIYNGSYYVLLFNHSKALFRDPETRKAFDHIADEDEITLTTLHRHSKPTTGPFRIDSFACDPDVESRDHSIDMAHALLARHGWRLSGGVLCKNGRKLHLSIAMQDSSRLVERIATALRSQLLKAGITTDLVYTDGDQDIRNSCDLILAQLSASGDPDACYGYWHSSYNNGDKTKYSNPEVDKLFELGRQTVDFEKRKAVYRQIHQIMHEDCAAIFLCTASRFLTSRYILPSGYSFLSINHFLFSIKDWEIETYRAAQKNGARATAEI